MLAKAVRRFRLLISTLHVGCVPDDGTRAPAPLGREHISNDVFLETNRRLTY